MLYKWRSSRRVNPEIVSKTQFRRVVSTAVSEGLLKSKVLLWGSVLCHLSFLIYLIYQDARPHLLFLQTPSSSPDPVTIKTLWVVTTLKRSLPLLWDVIKMPVRHQSGLSLSYTWGGWDSTTSCTNTSYDPCTHWVVSDRTLEATLASLTHHYGQPVGSKSNPSL